MIFREYMKFVTTITQFTTITPLHYITKWYFMNSEKFCLNWDNKGGGVPGRFFKWKGDSNILDILNKNEGAGAKKMFP